MFDNFRKPVAPKNNNDIPAPAPGFGDVDIWDTGTTDAPAGAPQGGFFPQGNDAPQPDIPQDPMGTFNNAPTHNVLNQDVTVEGILRFTDDLLVDGQVVGEITSDGTLTVGSNAVIRAGESNKVAISTKSAIIQGKVTGDVVVTDRVELASTAELVGDVTAARIAIQEGAVFVGHCMVGAAAVAAAAAPAPKRGGKGKGGASTNLLS